MLHVNYSACISAEYRLHATGNVPCPVRRGSGGTGRCPHRGAARRPIRDACALPDHQYKTWRGGEVIANRRSIAEGVQSGGGICRGTVLGDLARVDEEKGLVRGDDCVRDEDRIERYVRSAQIEQP